MTTPTEQNQALILEAMKQNRNRILFFLSLVTYCLLAVLATTDKDLFFTTGIKLPLLGVELPLLAFYIVMPIFIILAHFNMLYLFNKHIDNLKEINSNTDSNKFLSAGIFDFIALSKDDPFQKIIKFFVFFVLYFLPLITLYLFWWRFNAYQNSLISFLHIFYLIVDTYIVISFIVISFIWREFKYLVSTPFTFVFIAIIIQITIAIDILPTKWYPQLSLSGEQLVDFDRDRLLVLQNLDKEKHNSLAFYQPAFDLSNRSFKYANFSNSTLININFSDARLQGANLRGVQLQGANLFGAQLQGANLIVAELQGASLVGVQLQGASLVGAQLQGANLFGAQLQGANLFGAKLQGVDLFGAKLQGVDLRVVDLQGASLGAAQLQGANLFGAELQGANLDEAELQGANLSAAQLQGANLGAAQLQGANLGAAQLQGANLDEAELQGAYVGEHFDSLNFVERINQQTDKETDIQILEKQYEPLDEQQKKSIIAELRKINKPWIEDAIERIKNAGDALDLSGAKTGSYNKQQAQQWIKQYKKRN